MGPSRGRFGADSGCSGPIPSSILARFNAARLCLPGIVHEIVPEFARETPGKSQDFCKPLISVSYKFRGAPDLQVAAGTVVDHGESKLEGCVDARSDDAGHRKAERRIGCRSAARCCGTSTSNSQSNDGRLVRSEVATVVLREMKPPTPARQEL